MTIESFLLLFTTMLFVAVLPGPAVFAVSSASIIHGFGRGTYMTLGIICADYLFITLAVFGLSAVSEIMGEAFVIVKYVCAAYLIWMGVSLWRSKAVEVDESTPVTEKYSAFLTGLLIALSNPKAIVFYVALFPAFVNINSVSMLDVVGIMACATFSFGTINLMYAYIASQARSVVKTAKGFSVVRKIAASVITLTGVTVVIRA